MAPTTPHEIARRIQAMSTIACQKSYHAGEWGTGDRVILDYSHLDCYNGFIRLEPDIPLSRKSYSIQILDCLVNVLVHEAKSDVVALAYRPGSQPEESLELFVAGNHEIPEEKKLYLEVLLNKLQQIAKVFPQKPLVILDDDTPQARSKEKKLRQKEYMLRIGTHVYQSCWPKVKKRLLKYAKSLRSIQDITANLDLIPSIRKVVPELAQDLEMVYGYTEYETISMAQAYEVAGLLGEAIANAQVLLRSLPRHNLRDDSEKKRLSATKKYLQQEGDSDLADYWQLTILRTKRLVAALSKTFRISGSIELLTRGAMSSRMGPFFRKTIAVTYLRSRPYKSLLDYEVLVTDWETMHLNFPDDCVDRKTRKAFLHEHVNRNIGYFAPDCVPLHAELKLMQKMLDDSRPEIMRMELLTKEWEVLGGGFPPACPGETRLTIIEETLSKITDTSERDAKKVREWEILKEMSEALESTKFLNYIAISKLPCMTCSHFMKAASSMWPTARPPNNPGSHGKWYPTLIPEEVFQDFDDILGKNFAYEVYTNLLNRFRRGWRMLNEANAFLDDDTASSSSMGANFTNYPRESLPFETFMARQASET